ncbi:MAG: hypothetical protein HYY16_15015 [Planctomycetes bacterium]|nr:hypothetical protein [Planctomycetota bacterium]
MIITMVVILILAALTAAVMTEVVFHQKETQGALDGDQGMVIARAGLDRARRALFKYRADGSFNTAEPSGEAQWNAILASNAMWTGAVVTPGTIALPGSRYYPNPAATPLEEWIDGVRQNYDAVANTNEFEDYLADPNAAGAGLTPEDPAGDDWATNDFVIFGQCKPFRRGAYHVIVRDNEGEAGEDGDPLTDVDDTIICTVTSIYDDGTGNSVVRQIEARLEYDPPYFTPEKALLSGGDMSLGGGAGLTVNGAAAGVHANGTMTINGAPAIGGTVTQGVSSPAPTPPATYAPSEPIPDIDPAEYADDYPADTYTLRDNGTIVDGFGNPIGSIPGFSWNAAQGRWELSGSPTTHKIYYCETDLRITSAMGGGGGGGKGGKAGGGGAPVAVTVEATFLSAGHIDWSGNYTVTPYAPAGGEVWGITAVAAKDIDMSGTGGALNMEGLIAAGEQIRLQGNVTVLGAVVAENDGNTPPGGIISVPNGMEAGGGPTITYNGGLTTVIEVATTVSIVRIERTYPR